MTDTTPSTSSTPFHFPEPTPTASLLLSHRPPAGKIALVLGTSKLAASRCFACLEAGIRPVVIDVEAPGRNGKQVCAELEHRIASGQVARHSIAHSVFHSSSSVETTFSDILDTFDGETNAIFAVCVTDTLHSGDDDSTPSSKATSNIDIDNGDDSLFIEAALTSYARAQIISKLCRRRRIPVNVADKPELCDFSFPAHCRFPCTASSQSTGSTSAASSLQIAVTTNGRGCRLAGRIRREIVSALPHNVGDAVERVGVMRDLAKRRSEPPSHYAKRWRKNGTAEVEEEDLSFDTTPLNSPVPQLTSKNPLEGVAASAKLRQLQAKREEAEERTKRRMRWVAQISEYWPIEYLGNLDEGAMEEALRAHGEADPTWPTSDRTVSVDTPRGRAVARPDEAAVSTVSHRARSQHSLDIRPPMPVSRRGHIYLLGSGPGHPGLLTTFAYRLLTSPSTSLILSDKLVPSSILSLIPRTTPLEIAKKFPGNAEGAQSELIAKALRAALEEGKTVVRLKQGDPFVYGRGGEEVLAFRNAGIECTVVPGISSCVAAPAMLGIPVTQRGAADSLVLCTGVGKGGKKVKLPGYERGRSLVVLMGVARLRAVVATLTDGAPQTVGAVEGDSIGDRDGAVFPPYTPIAIIERASSPDQRMVASTLEGIVEALEGCGEQRPPGMMLIGWSVLALEGRGDVTIQDDGMSSDGEELEKRDRQRVAAWLKGRRWIVREGLDQAYREAGAAFHTSPLQFAPETVAPSSLVHHAEGGDEERFRERDGAGWAPPRYATGVPEGGWVEGEAPNRPATDQIKYEQDRTYAEVQARLRE